MDGALIDVASMWQSWHLAQVHLGLGALLSMFASHTQRTKGVYGRKKSFTDLELMEAPPKSWFYEFLGHLHFL